MSRWEALCGPAGPTVRIRFPPPKGPLRTWVFPGQSSAGGGRADDAATMDEEVPTPTQVFLMATSGGAKTTPFADTIGALEAGRAADIVLIDWYEISYPYLDAQTPLLDAALQRAKTRGVRTV